MRWYTSLSHIVISSVCLNCIRRNQNVRYKPGLRFKPSLWFLQHVIKIYATFSFALFLSSSFRSVCELHSACACFVFLVCKLRHSRHVGWLWPRIFLVCNSNIIQHAENPFVHWIPWEWLHTRIITDSLSDSSETHPGEPYHQFRFLCLNRLNCMSSKQLNTYSKLLAK